MGCGQSVNKFAKQNQQGIFPPEQVREVLEHVWGEKLNSEAPTATGPIADQIITETITTLGTIAGQEKTLNEVEYIKIKAGLIKGGMFGKTFTVTFEQAQ